jgi:histidine triad (HIT) family protein
MLLRNIDDASPLNPLNGGLKGLVQLVEEGRMGKEDCIFCRIAAGEIPSAKLFEDENVLAFLDINPLSKGHTLVILKEHVPDVFAVSPEKLGLLAGALPRIAEAVRKSMGADGMNILLNNGECSGQLVPHIHFHLIPRKGGDGLSMRWPAGSYEEGEMDAVLEKIKAHL